MMSIESSRKFRVFSFIATLLVVVYHARFPSLSQTRLVMQVEPFFARLYEFLCGISMAYFFTTSGYMLCNGLRKSNAGQKFRRRIYTLIIPFFAWNCIYFAADFLFRKDTMDLRPSVILYKLSFDPYNGPLWYVFSLFILSTLVILTVYFIKSRTLLTVIGSFIIVVSVCIESFGLFLQFGLSGEEHIIVWLTRLFRYLPSYVIGCYLGLFHKDCVEYEPAKNARIAAGMLTVCLSLYMVFIPKHQKIENQITLTVMPLCIWAFVNSRRMKDEISPHIQGAFLIYAMHFMVIMLFRFFLEKILPHSISDVSALMIWLLFPYGAVILTYLASRLLSFILHKLHLYKVESILTGNRK